MAHQGLLQETSFLHPNHKQLKSTDFTGYKSLQWPHFSNPPRSQKVEQRAWYRIKPVDSLWIVRSLRQVEAGRGDGVLRQQTVGVVATHVGGGRSRPPSVGRQEGAVALALVVSEKVVGGISCVGLR